jgi:hypothetical protein
LGGRGGNKGKSMIEGRAGKKKGEKEGEKSKKMCIFAP